MVDPAVITTAAAIPAETPQEAKTRQLKAIVEYQREYGFAGLYQDRLAAIEKLKEQKTNGHS
jgi:hypothetical protein